MRFCGDEMNAFVWYASALMLWLGWSGEVVVHDSDILLAEKTSSCNHG